jgi:hypothetical protein
MDTKQAGNTFHPISGNAKIESVEFLKKYAPLHEQVSGQYCHRLTFPSHFSNDRRTPTAGRNSCAGTVSFPTVS